MSAPTREIEISGGPKQEFILAYNPLNQLPAWVTESDELWLAAASASLHQFLLYNIDKLGNNEIRDPKDFAATLDLEFFKNAIMGGEVARLRAYILTLWELLSRDITAPENTYICFFSNTDSPHFISAMVINYGKKVLINAKMNDISLGDDTLQ